uniref:Uncharacterized protein n=1 Tax=Alexandrium monilatum TaxID=311494 RepID=A0A7S4ULQ3_9DINO
MAGFFEQFVQVALTCLLRRGAPRGQVGQVHELLAKLACLREPTLEATLRRLLSEVCRAYLASYEMLHPALQALIDLWPDDAETLGQWALEQFSPLEEEEQGDDLPPPPPAADAPSSIGLQSVSASLPHTPTGELLPANGEVGTPPSNGPSPSQGRLPAAVEEEEGGGEPPREEAALPAGPASPQAGALGSPTCIDPPEIQQDMQAERLSQETEGLRQELEKAKEDQRKALQEAEMLRNELSAAQAQHRRVEDEITQLQKRKEELLVQKANQQQPSAASQEKPRRRRPQAAQGPSAEEFQKAAELVTAFQEPLQQLCSRYCHKRATQTGSRQAVSMDAFERLLSEVEVLPMRLSRKAVPQAIRASGVQLLDDGALLQEHFLALLPQLAARSFKAQEATPFRDFGVPVPIDEEPAVRLQVQALLQHLARTAESSRAAAVRSVRPAMARTLRLHVLRHAETTLASLNARLEQGDDLAEQDLPEGFEVVESEPTSVYLVPEGLPVRASERHSVELLDEILAAALGVHFLEPLPVDGPRRCAAVRGHADLAALALEPAAADSKQANRLIRVSSERDISHPQAKEARDSVALPAAQTALPHEGRENRRQPPAAQQSRAQAALKPPKDRRTRKPPSLEPPDGQSEATKCVPAQGEGRRQHRSSPGRTAPEAPPPPVPRGSPPQQRRSVQPPAAAAPSRKPSMAGVGNPELAGDPARAVAKRQDKVMQRHRASAQEVKGRQEAIQATLRSEGVQRLVRSVEPNLRRAFDFFARWKGGDASAMPLLGFLNLGECFGILGKESLKVVFRLVGGQGLSFETFPEALFQCVVRLSEVEEGAGEGPAALADDTGLWSRGFQALCRHMLLANGKALRGCMDAYRRDGEVLPPFSLAEARMAANSAVVPREAGNLTAGQAPQVESAADPRADAALEAEPLEAAGGHPQEPSGAPGAKALPDEPAEAKAAAQPPAEAAEPPGEPVAEVLADGLQASNAAAGEAAPEAEAQAATTAAPEAGTGAEEAVPETEAQAAAAAAPEASRAGTVEAAPEAESEAQAATAAAPEANGTEAKEAAPETEVQAQAEPGPEAHAAAAGAGTAEGEAAAGDGTRTPVPAAPPAAESAAEPAAVAEVEAAAEQHAEGRQGGLLA